MVEHAGEQIFLVGHVVVQRHGLDAQTLTSPAHAQPIDARLVGQLDRGGEHSLTGKRHPFADYRFCLQRH